MKAIIIDIDGTVAQKCHSRDIHDLTQVGFDYPIWPTITVIENMMTEYMPIFVSGRKEVARKATEQWLLHYVSFPKYDYGNGAPGTLLFMRQNDDNRCDTIIKREIYEKEIKGQFDVFCVFDDRKKVIDMWRSLGLFVFNCSQLEDNDF